MLASHLRLPRIQPPSISSERPAVSARCGTGYISAVSKKHMPSSMHAHRRRSAAARSVLSPNNMHPEGGGVFVRARMCVGMKGGG